MSSKKNPGKFDCYKNAEPTEEMFVLLGRDEFAGDLVRLWIALRLHNFEEAQELTDTLIETAKYRDKSTNLTKMAEAQECAARLDKWLTVLDDRDRKAREASMAVHMRRMLNDAKSYLASKAKPKRATRRKTKK